MSDREKLIELLGQVQDDGAKIFPTGQGDRIDLILNEKVADHLIANGVVIPVRCKECKMWEPGDSMMGDSIDDMQRVGGCPISRFRRLENDSCSYGERRTDG